MNIKKVKLLAFLIVGIASTVLLLSKSFKVIAKAANSDLGENEYKYIYLTFDDGPLNGSEKVNDAILAEKIPVTVLLVGEHSLFLPKDVELYKENKYIEVGNHSYSHANNHYLLYYSKPKNVLADFIKNMKVLKLDSKIGRLPGRNMWRVHGRSRNDISSGIQAANLLAKNGFALFGWDMEWMHNSHTSKPIGTAEEIFKKMERLLDENKTFTKSHLVLLCHDEMFHHDYEESELKKLIDLLKTRDDYKFAHLEDYP